jgi:CubicO group peptidase (beta-lactamase class C family)
MRPGGWVAAGLEGVADAFASVCAQSRGGCAFAVVADGMFIVDLWGGEADPEMGSAWKDDTIVEFFSASKPLVATCILLLVENGLIGLDEPVQRYWPEFGAQGKERVLVAHVLSHRAGVPGLDRGFPLEDLLDPARMATAVAAEQPLWPAGKQLAYHAYTFGWICGELIRRIDGRPTGQFFADEVARPLGLDVWIGLPGDLETRVAMLVTSSGFELSHFGSGVGKPADDGSFVGGRGQSSASFLWNQQRIRGADIPGANGIGGVRDAARFYGALARGGEIDGVRLLRPDTVALARHELARGTCQKTGRPYAFGAGFELQTELARFGPPRDAFGHTGAGGSTHGAWPSRRVGFAFSPSELRPEASDDRGTVLLAALDRALGATR